MHELVVAGWGTACGARDGAGRGAGDGTDRGAGEGITLSRALVDQRRVLVLFRCASGRAGVDRLAFADAEVKAHVRRVHAGVNNNCDEDEENREKIHGDRSFMLLDVSNVSMCSRAVTTVGGNCRVVKTLVSQSPLTVLSQNLLPSSPFLFQVLVPATGLLAERVVVVNWLD